MSGNKIGERLPVGVNSKDSQEELISQFMDDPLGTSGLKLYTSTSGKSEVDRHQMTGWNFSKQSPIGIALPRGVNSSASREELKAYYLQDPAGTDKNKLYTSASGQSKVNRFDMSQWNDLKGMIGKKLAVGVNSEDSENELIEQYIADPERTKGSTQYTSTSGKSAVNRRDMRGWKGVKERRKDKGVQPQYQHGQLTQDWTRRYNATTNTFDPVQEGDFEGAYHFKGGRWVTGQHRELSVYWTRRYNSGTSTWEPIEEGDSEGVYQFKGGRWEQVYRDDNPPPSSSHDPYQQQSYVQNQNPTEYSAGSGLTYSSAHTFNMNQPSVYSQPQAEQQPLEEFEPDDPRLYSADQ